jgi:hypothetical protein
MSTLCLRVTEPPVVPDSPRTPRSRRTFHSHDFLSLSSTSRIHPTTSAWSILFSHLHEFANFCYLYQIGPDLLVSFTNCDRLFEDFVRRARAVFNNVRPSATETIATRSMGRAADQLLMRWRDFIRQFVAINTQSSSPIYLILGDRLLLLIYTLQSLSAIFSSPQPLVSFGPIRKVRLFVETLRIEAVKLESKARAIAVRESSSKGFHRRLVELITNAQILFPDVIPKTSMMASGIAILEKDLNSACDEVARADQGIERFDELTKLVTESIKGMTNQFQVLFKSLSITPRVVVLVGKEMLEEKEKNEQLEDEMEGQEIDERKVKDCCNRMRRSIAAFETALVETSSLFRTKR